jgi:hypothetical protein
MTRKLIIIALLLALTACNLPSVQTPSPEQPGPATGPALTLDILRNATYQLPFYNRIVTLTDGKYRYESGVELLDVFLLDVYALGDLNGDGVDDAAIIFAENGGGSGTFESVVAVYNENGVPVQAGAGMLGDRVLVSAVRIESGEIVLDVVVQGPNDPLCCPSLPTTQTFRMVEGALWLTRLTTKLSNGAERIITITSPAGGAEVTNPFTITGSVTIAPFENTLAVRIYLPDGTLVNESPLMVDAPDLGAPGTFSLTLDLSSAGVSGPVIVQFVDVSMADGSTLALGSVVVNLH